MNKYQTISVTEDDIAHGVQSDCDRCPIARAVERTLPTWYGIRGQQLVAKVSSSHIEVAEPVGAGWPITLGTIGLPRSAQRFIERFDNDKPVKPFTFKVPTISVLDAIQ